MRNQSHNDFHVEVEGMGRFVFARRQLNDHFAIAAEYSRLTEGVSHPTEWLHMFATAVSLIRVLTTSFPAGFDLDELDPLDDETYEKILKVYLAYREKEDSFRQGKNKTGQAGSQGSGE